MTALDLIQAELAHQAARADVQAVEAHNSRNDRIAVALAYLGRASAGVIRNEREGHDPKAMLVKAAAVLVAAIEAE